MNNTTDTAEGTAGRLASGDWLADLAYEIADEMDHPTTRWYMSLEGYAGIVYRHLTENKKLSALIAANNPV